MGRDIYKFTKNVDDVIVMLILWRHQNETAEKIADFRAFWLNISKTVQLIFAKLTSFLGPLYVEVFEIKRLQIDCSLLPW